ncbi:MAG TPA: VOC family protein [Candidatus Udaeobacter sp.]|nr:VOC family protein [Candidatus Udaeobacter sp.]
MCALKAIPEGFHSITPAIVCKGAASAIEYYKEVFHAKEKLRMPGPGGAIIHAELAIGDSILMLSDEFPGMTSAPPADAPNSINLFLYTDDVDTVFNRAVKAGAKVEMPLENQFWGDRYGKIRDPFGHRWGLAQHIEDVAPEEMKKRSEAFTAKMSKAAGK